MNILVIGGGGREHALVWRLARWRNAEAAARFAVDPPPPIIKPRQDTAAPKPAEKRPDQIFTF